MLKIWGRVNSVNVKKVLWAVEELGLKYERIDAGMQHGVVNTPEYKKMNPNALVPTIDDDGFVLWESHSIVRYLAAKHGAGTLWPADLKQRADSDRWMDWALTFQASFRTVFWGLVRTPPEKRDPKAIEDGKAKCAAALKIMDAQLAKTRFIASDEFSYGDIPIGPFAYRYLRLVPDHAPMPNVERWYGEISARPAFKQHVLDVPFT
jgi:glutathione S-transferase